MNRTKAIAISIALSIVATAFILPILAPLIGSCIFPSFRAG